MTITAKVVADSTSPTDKRITTLQLKYPRFIHAEILTHRVLSRNASSSRAIPVKKMIQNIIDDPAMPIHWGKNIPGMKAKQELKEKILIPFIWQKQLKFGVFPPEKAWLQARDRAIQIALAYENAGYHKQVVNRLLEPFQHIEVICTATEWNNFFHLRDHEDAQPQIQELARQIKQALTDSSPKLVNYDEWHLPYITENDRLEVQSITKSSEKQNDLLKKISTARCCRVSYLKHDGTAPSINDDLALYDKLVTSKPVHASPTEHQAAPDRFMFGGYMNSHLHGNFVGWIQHRQLIKDNYVSG